MRNKCAVVIVYEGTPIEGEEHRKVAEAFMKSVDNVVDGRTVSVYGLGPDDIAAGILAKALNGTGFFSDSMPVENQIDAAARFVAERFAKSIAEGISTLAADVSATYVSIKMRGFSVLSTEEATLINSIELLSEENAYNAISPSVRRKYHLTKTVIDIIKHIHDSICRGHIVMYA